MRVYKKNTGKKYTPFDHFKMTTQVIFNPDNGSKFANVTLSTLGQNAGSNDEVHDNSDQIFVVLQGKIKISANGELLHELSEGDAILIEAGDVHAVINEYKEECVFCAITVPPLEKTH